MIINTKCKCCGNKVKVLWGTDIWGTSTEYNFLLLKVKSYINMPAGICRECWEKMAEVK